MSYLKTKDLSQLSYIIHHSFSYTEPYINHSSFLLLNLFISYIWSTTYKQQNLFLNFYYTCVHACVHVCVRVCPHCQPPCGGHGNTSFACLMMWLMAASPSLTMWWRPGGVRGPSHWSCKPTTGIHHAYASYNARSGCVCVHVHVHMHVCVCMCSLINCGYTVIFLGCVWWDVTHYTSSDVQ